MRKLGFWNRLAVVLSGLTLALAPPISIISNDLRQARVYNEIYEKCMAAALQAGDVEEQMVQEEFCRSQRLARLDRPSPWTLSNWTVLVTGWGLICATIYAVAFAAQWLASWVWRGREE